MKRILFSIVVNLFILGYMAAQDFSQKVFNNYDNYREPVISARNFTHSEILPLIKKLETGGKFRVQKAGSSVEGRDIYHISLGQGKTNVMLWSQMHGDESTATMALMDIFNFFNTSDEFDDIKERILSKLTLHFVPMLNPDGAERFQRRNALGIDLNRDALRLECPESRILKGLRDSLKADFGFNLHDQGTRYSAGRSFKPSSISFLAPAVSFEKEVNPVRERAMKVIANLYNVLSSFIPGHIAKYSDDFEPRAFGDNIQRWGTSTILIETGGWQNDPEKQFLRKINFTALISAFQSIAEGNYKKFDLRTYYNIPDNKEYIFDLLIRNVKINIHGNLCKTDIGINRHESYSGNKTLWYRSIIEDLGDLSTFYGYEDYCCDSMEAVPGKTYPQILDSFQEINALRFDELLKDGFTSVVVKNDIPKERFSGFPVLIKSDTRKESTDVIAVNSIANFVIRQNGKPRFAVINGFIYDLNTSTNMIHNGLIVQ